MAPITIQDLQRALHAGELGLVYQPEVELGTGHICAVETLVRWHHPIHGMVLPPSFVPLAERTGQIGTISALVLRAALAQAAQWSQSRWDGDALPIWVNLSACELSDPSLHRRVMATLAEFGVCPSQLGFEITESAPILNDDVAARTLQALDDDGVRLAIDDFGTGYSSLAHLKHLPAQAIKIDRMFVSGISHPGADASIIESLTQMAHALGRSVIAEGVERADQLRALGELGCDVGQGFLFGRPQPADRLEILLAADRELAAYPATRPGDAAPTLPRPRAEIATTGRRG